MIRPFEKEILHILEQNARTKVETIAAMVNRTVAEVQEAIVRLEQEKVIVKHTTLVNWNKVGVNTVQAMIDVKVTPQREVGFDEVAARIYRFPEVKNVYLMSGTYDLSVVVEGKSLQDVAIFISEKLSTLDHVVSTATHFILKTYKHDGVIYPDSEDDDKRMIVTP